MYSEDMNIRYSISRRIIKSRTYGAARKFYPLFHSQFNYIHLIALVHHHPACISHQNHRYHDIPPSSPSSCSTSVSSKPHNPFLFLPQHHSRRSVSPSKPHLPHPPNTDLRRSCGRHHRLLRPDWGQSEIPTSTTRTTAGSITITRSEAGVTEAGS